MSKEQKTAEGKYNTAEGSSVKLAADVAIGSGISDAMQV